MNLKLKDFSFQDTYGLLWVVGDSSIASCNAYKLGKTWRFSVSYRHEQTVFETWEDARKFFMEIEKMENQIC
jgi:hypothetical protein